MSIARPVLVTARITSALTGALTDARTTAPTGTGNARAIGPGVHARPLARDILARALARAIDLSLARTDFRIVHLGVRLSARAPALELVVEAADKRALARGMQGLQVSAARGLNRAARRTGGVFVDRYRARVIASRRALAAALARTPRGLVVLHRAA